MTSEGSRLLDFYRGHGVDSGGRSFEQVMQFDHARLERTHDYVQWLFPIFSQSPFNPNAPTLDPQTIQAFREDDELKRRAVRALKLMLGFLGLECDDSEPDDVVIQCAPDFAARRKVWISPGNHNYRRITRLLLSLDAMGLAGYGAALFDCLERIYPQCSGLIGETTLRFWRQAVR